MSADEQEASGHGTGGRLKLRRGQVVSEDPLIVEVDGERRAAWADGALLGDMREGDEVVVNVEALDLGLGSGGFDVVHVNLTRGLQGDGGGGKHAMKLNYTSLQHPVEPVERPLGAVGPGGQAAERERAAAPPPVLVIPLHGHLAPAAWAAARAAPGIRVGYVQTAGGALPGSFCRDVVELRRRKLLSDHVTASPAYGGEREALSVAGALDAASQRLRWDAAIVGPGPGIIGSATQLGHGGMAALDAAHAALALGLPTLLSPRLSEGDPRERHRGVSHHTLTVLDLLLGEVDIPVPAGEAISGALLDGVAARLAEAAGGRHRLLTSGVDLDEYATTGLPARTMGRDLSEDGLFFAAPLAAGLCLAAQARRGEPR